MGVQAFRDEKGGCIVPHNPVLLVQHAISRLESTSFLFLLAWRFIMMNLENLLLIYEEAAASPHLRNVAMLSSSSESQACNTECRVKIPGRAKNIVVIEMRLSCHWFKDCLETPGTISALCLGWLYS